ncbi:MAG: NAD-dependent epimerase/dehydratase family protein [Pirellula sp.]|jgi:UDP-2-acetamido-2,6-beta-L-arabino-hexul-4-ose reductase|nr:NAD-dependent epimerase/dehydratase family protein [Pirellula sp.]
MQKIIVTGSQGFLGRNLLSRLNCDPECHAIGVDRSTSVQDLFELIRTADVIIHLAGVNRPKDTSEFDGNFNYLESILRIAESASCNPAVLLSSSIQATNQSPYGLSKLRTEEVLASYSKRTQAKISIFRLPNVFGKWGKPNYNSAVNTFCYNLSRNLPITINDPAAPLKLVYVDDVVEVFHRFAKSPVSFDAFPVVAPVYETTVGDIADMIKRMVESRVDLRIGRVGAGLERAVYSTLLSYLPEKSFAYQIPGHTDQRGTFVEMLRFPDAGQMSFFTAHPGVTRGGHFHHTKIEKFLVVQGKACFRFRDTQTDATYSLDVTHDVPTIVESIPGWAHEVTNIGEETLICMLWANEIFDRNRPDTYSCKV